MSDERAFTVVSFHAHPDDEALLTAGTLAGAAADGHRVVIVVATSGEAGLAAGRPTAAELGRRREHELAASAAAIGAARVVLLGHADSGSVAGEPPVQPGTFASLDPQVVALELAAILVEERADVLTTYDAAGGYGHPDHVQVHQVGTIAARMAETPVVLEATVDRELLLRATRLLRRAAVVLPVPRLPDLRSAFTPRHELTHRVDVRPHLDEKLRALRAHVSQAASDDEVRTLALLLHLPRPVQRRVLGVEWFRETGRVPGTTPLHDVFATFRTHCEAG
ncbi:MAG TPA: PIG-L family deacetylase [Nocardioides sp.]|uniref:PIG-L deacetylase family protein n=1 Tax=Nocardioides sp. TaxID=35761 RepID=UPI002E313739|nr:PIG-L family deacetylase [Nocardioides sp.]HEX5087628.1 PIG-L family deacetylase [Nocardioides sp.]